jgi:hypothetical protein
MSEYEVEHFEFLYTEGVTDHSLGSRAEPRILKLFGLFANTSAREGFLKLSNLGCAAMPRPQAVICNTFGVEKQKTRSLNQRERGRVSFDVAVSKDVRPRLRFGLVKKKARLSELNRASGFTLAAYQNFLIT